MPNNIPNVLESCKQCIENEKRKWLYHSMQIVQVIDVLDILLGMTIRKCLYHSMQIVQE